MTLTEFEMLLDAHGADTSRWPVAHRTRMLALCEENAEARALLGEARALDRALASAPLVDPRRLPELQSRILAAALASPRASGPERADGADATVVVLQPRTTPDSSANANRNWRESWHTGGLLAASLVLGLMLGTSLMNPEREATVDVVAALWGDGLSADMDEDGQ